MKMKKLLSIGVLGLVLATSTSIGAFAADRPTKDELQADMISILVNNKSPLVSYDIKSSTKVGDIVNLETLKTIIQKYEDGDDVYPNLNKALDLVESNKTLIENAKIIVNEFNKSDLDSLIEEIRSVAIRLREIENGATTSEGYGKSDLESDLKKLVKEKNSELDVFFGKNINGDATMSVMKSNQIVLQLSSGDAYKVSDFLYNNASSLTTYAQTFKSILENEE